MSVMALAVALTQASIVVTGAAVRLTGSGLGCDDWPLCTEDSLAPAWSFHGWIEFGNRLFAGVVLATAVAAWFVARRIDDGGRCRRWAGIVVLGTLAQAVVGGITVLSDLVPEIVAIHFLGSMALLWAAAELVLAASSRSRRRAAPWRDRHSSAVFGLAAAVLVVGTLVTGTGPNSGDAVADRLDFELVWIARIHAWLVWILVAAIVVNALRLRGADPGRRRQIQRLGGLAVAQGAVGYLQYALGLPPAIVAVHIVGAMAVWWSALWFHLGEARPEGPNAAAERATVGAAA